MLLLSSPTPLAAATSHVPQDFAAIQSAIAAATAGDTILVGPGTYNENLDTQGKHLTLRGVQGAAATIVDGGQRTRVLTITGGGVVEGFTLRRGHADYEGGGIHITGQAETIIRNNIITDNVAGVFDVGNGGGVYVYDFNGVNVLIESNTISDNYAGDSGGGIHEGAGAVVRGNTITRNGCHVCGGGIVGGGGVVMNNLIIDNWADSFGAGVCIIANERVEYNTVVHNYDYNGNPEHASGIHHDSGFPTISHNIVAFNDGGLHSGAGIRCARVDHATVECNDSWENGGGDYLLLGACDTTGKHNFSLDPVFCGPNDYTISINSPCSPYSYTGCGQVGAFGPACTVTPARRMSWGALKTIYR